MNNQAPRPVGSRSRRGQIALGAAVLLALAGVLVSSVLLAPVLAAQDADPPAPVDEEIVIDPTQVPEAGDDVRVIIDEGDAYIDGTLEAITDDQLILRVRGLVVPIQRDRVVSMAVRLTPGQRYRDIRPTIRDDDLPRLLNLVRWLEQNQLYSEALQELEGILRRNPDNEEARRLQTLVNQLIVLEEIRAKRRAQDNQRTRVAEEEAQRAAAYPRRAARNEIPTLTPEQINLIKVYEIDLTARPRLLIQRSTIDELLRRYAEHALIPTTRQGKAEFYRKPPVEILDIMFRVGARDLYGEVRVIGQPESMQRFRDEISARWLTNRCATTRCHGGTAAGRLQLINRAPNSEATVYTNFLILDRFDTNQPVPMIDYSNPADSLLLQMALPREDVLYPHPDVRGWRPVFVNDRSPRYRASLEWIRMMYQPRPDYPIEYTLPGEEIQEPDDGPPPPVER